MNITTEQVVRAQSGDKQALEEVIVASYRPCFSLAYRLLRNRDDAAEVTQEAYMRMLKSLKKLQDPGAFQTWMYRIVSNAAISRIRKRGRHLETLYDPADIEDPMPIDVEELAVGGLVMRELETLVDDLPETHRTVIVLRDIYGLSGDEAANTLGITESALKVRLHRARKVLRAKILDAHPDWATDRKESA